MYIVADHDVSHDEQLYAQHHASQTEPKFYMIREKAV